MRLLDVEDSLTPADHQTHRRYPFAVPANCTRLSLHVQYAPKFASAAETSRLVAHAVAHQHADLLTRGVEPALTDAWAQAAVGPERIANLPTVSLDDASGVYRGAAHRQPADMRLVLASDAASPGLVAGPLPAGEWQLTVSIHTLVSPSVTLSIHVGADTASSDPSAARSST